MPGEENPPGPAKAGATTSSSPPQSSKKQPGPKSKSATGASTAPADGTGAGAGTGTGSEPQLTPAQLKAKAKAEKAARRSQVKAAKAVVPSGDRGAAAPASEASKQPAAVGPPTPTPLEVKKKGSRPQGPRPVEAPAASIGSIPEIFSHLPVAIQVTLSQAQKDVHPAVLALGQRMATFALRDSIARLEATLLAFRQVVESYETPEGNSFSRHFVPHVLNPQIEYLTECRPMCFAMGNAIRLLKSAVNEYDIDTSADEARQGLLETIDTFVKERITLAGFIIARSAAATLADGSVVLTYGRHRLVEEALLRAARHGRKQFDVIILDDPYDPTGAELAKALGREAGVEVLYAQTLGGLDRYVQRADVVLVGAEAMLANQALYAPAGTADVALAAHVAGKSFTVLCETINFDKERVAVDSVTYNEVDPDRKEAQSGFRLMFDTTPEQHISRVVTEQEAQ